MRVLWLMFPQSLTSVFLDAMVKAEVALNRWGKREEEEGGDYGQARGSLRTHPQEGHHLTLP